MKQMILGIYSEARITNATVHSVPQLVPAGIEIREKNGRSGRI